MNDHWTGYPSAYSEAKSLQAAKLSILQAKTVTDISDNIRSTGKDGIIKLSEVI
ncbi:hypothetical protein D1BOALGB6SA_5306 [Olavius sp. associated proteobacterium Delta 1]|nr:hypothetical protein D1BOALGB6SA_5306 [Olavius sp. associated proteobacterium Delta 1]